MPSHNITDALVVKVRFCGDWEFKDCLRADCMAYLKKRVADEFEGRQLSKPSSSNAFLMW